MSGKQPAIATNIFLVVNAITLRHHVGDINFLATVGILLAVQILEKLP